MSANFVDAVNGLGVSEIQLVVANIINNKVRVVLSQMDDDSVALDTLQQRAVEAK